MIQSISTKSLAAEVEYLDFELLAASLCLSGVAENQAIAICEHVREWIAEQAS